MSHFVSASCGGEKCGCGRPAMHKLGEEIMSDEPCTSCGARFISPEIDAAGAKAAKDSCSSFFHFTGPTGQRHNLTAYVCCLCFTRTLGDATGCPLADADKRALMVYRYAHDPDPGYGPPCEVLCPRCDGQLVATGKGASGVIMFLDCENCKMCCQAPYKERA